MWDSRKLTQGIRGSTSLTAILMVKNDYIDYH